MKTFQATVVVDAEHRGVIQFPADVKPGEYQITMMIGGFAETECVLLDKAALKQPLTFFGHNVGDWPDGFAVRREDIYHDDGRGDIVEKP